jgi:hypothetical protein
LISIFSPAKYNKMKGFPTGILFGIVATLWFQSESGHDKHTVCEKKYNEAAREWAERERNAYERGREEGIGIGRQIESEKCTQEKEEIRRSAFHAGYEAGYTEADESCQRRTDSLYTEFEFSLAENDAYWETTMRDSIEILESQYLKELEYQRVQVEQYHQQLREKTRKAVVNPNALRRGRITVLMMAIAGLAALCSLILRHRFLA